VFFAGTLLLVHIVFFRALERGLEEEFEQSALARMRLLEGWAQEHGLLAPERQDDFFEALPAMQDTLAFSGAGFLSERDLQSGSRLSFAERLRLGRSKAMTRVAEEAAAVECYLLLADGRVLRVTFPAAGRQWLMRMARSLSWFEGAALVLLLGLLIGLFFWYAAPFSRMLDAAGGGGSLSPLGRDERAYLVGTFEAAMRELRKRAETMERLSGEIARGVASGVVTLDAEGRVVRANQAARGILGIDSSIEGRGYADVFPAGRLRDLVENVLSARKPVSEAETRHPAPQGEERTLAVSLSPMYDAEETFLGALCLLTDMTRLRNLEETLRLKENMARLGEMTAGVAHEFRNTLASILSFAQLIEKRTARSDETAADYAREILNETSEAQRVVNDFLRFARPVELKRERVLLRPLFEEIVREVDRGSASVGVEASPEAASLAAAGDASLLKQAFLNLLRNALDAVREKGSGGRVRLRLEDGGEGVRAVVEDNGVGMDAETRSRAFLPFFTTKERGTGLGLALVQKIVLSHDGSVRVESEPGKGTRAEVTLPKAGRG
jgi:PAS domain S-box-containing protein